MLRRVAIGFALLAVMFTARAQSYFIYFTPPLPADTNGSLVAYQGSWQYTNTAATNTWYFFGQVKTNVGKISIPPTVGAPAWLIVRSVGTNGLLSTNLTKVLYDTNALAATLTNNPPVIPAGPTTFVITNQ